MAQKRKINPNIIYTGALTKEKLKLLFFQYYSLKNEDTQFNPSKNHNIISLHKDEDGNYTGKMWKNDQLLEIRDIGPESVLQYLLTHPGV